MTPDQHLTKLSQELPEAWKWLEDMLLNPPAKWHPSCFLPIAGWYAIASACLRVKHIDMANAGVVSRLGAIGPWRYSRGIYKFDLDTYAALIHTPPITGKIPSDVFFRLPEWSIYVETPSGPGTPWSETDVLGFWAHIEQDANDGSFELRILINTRGDLLIPIVVSLGDWSVDEAILKVLKEADKDNPVVMKGVMDNIQEILDLNKVFIALLLYICSNEPEIDSAREPGTSPQRPTFTKTKKGLRLFPAVKANIWQVGKGLGDKIRQQSQNYTGRSVTPHLRRAHWHGFWTGPRDGERIFKYNWIPPIFVTGREDEDAKE